MSGTAAEQLSALPTIEKSDSDKESKKGQENGFSLAALEFEPGRIWQQQNLPRYHLHLHSSSNNEQHLLWAKH